MRSSDPVDTARLSLMLTDLRLPGISRAWHSFTERADTEGWPAAGIAKLFDPGVSSIEAT